MFYLHYGTINWFLSVEFHWAQFTNTEPLVNSLHSLGTTGRCDQKQQDDRVQHLCSPLTSSHTQAPYSTTPRAREPQTSVCVPMYDICASVTVYALFVSVCTVVLTPEYLCWVNPFNCGSGHLLRQL